MTIKPRYEIFHVSAPGFQVESQEIKPGAFLYIKLKREEPPLDLQNPHEIFILFTGGLVRLPPFPIMAHFKELTRVNVETKN